ncbi:MAG: hypothetical protein V1720_12320 [bacterium]
MMKKLILVFYAILTIATTICAQQSEFPKLTGPYLGQTPPLDDPLVFAPGIVSKGSNASTAAVSPDGKEIYWDVDKIWFTKLENGKWIMPEMVSFCKEDKYIYRVPCISPNGNRLFFLSTRAGSVSQDKENIWYAEKTSEGWSLPKPVNSKVNALRIHWNISVSNTGTLYFQGTRLDIQDNGGIYYARLENGEYIEPVKMEPEINVPGTMTTCPYVATDESYIVFNRMGQSPETSGIYISYKSKSGKWLPAVMLIGGSREKGGLSPRITPDGKYLFYVNGDMYWMAIAKRIEELRPKE